MMPMKKRTVHSPSNVVTVPTRNVGMEPRISTHAMTLRAPYRALNGPQMNRAKMVAINAMILLM